MKIDFNYSRRIPINNRLFANIAYLAIALLLIPGCNHSFGPEGLRNTHPLYNDAIVSTINEQFIQNIVRLHYRDPTFFLDVTNVADTLKLEINGGLYQSSIGATSANDILKINAGATYTTQPTISYSPLQGENFVKSMMSPITIEALLSLTGSGWNSERVFGLCVERINDLDNAPSASGPTPSTAPESSRSFSRLLQLMEKAFDEKMVLLHVDEKTKKSQLEIKSSPEHEDLTREIKQLL
jgi:hypothetical protein